MAAHPSCCSRWYCEVHCGGLHEPCDMRCADASRCCDVLQGNAAKQTVRLAFEKIRGLQLELEDKIKVGGTGASGCCACCCTGLLAYPA